MVGAEPQEGTPRPQERRVGVLAQRGRERLGAAGACGAVGVHPGAKPGGQGELELNFNLRQVSRVPQPGALSHPFLFLGGGFGHPTKRKVKKVGSNCF